MPSAGTKERIAVTTILLAAVVSLALGAMFFNIKENMEKVFIGTFIILAMVGLALLFAWPTLWIVNYLFTTKVLLTIFGIPKLTFWKAFWLNFITSALFKGTTTVKTK